MNVLPVCKNELRFGCGCPKRFDSKRASTFQVLANLKSAYLLSRQGRKRSCLRQDDQRELVNCRCGTTFLPPGLQRTTRESLCAGPAKKIFSFLLYFSTFYFYICHHEQNEFEYQLVVAFLRPKLT